MAIGKHLFHLRELEKSYGYAQAVKVGNMLYISGTVSIDDDGTPLAPGDMAGQVRNIYTDINRTLAAHGATLGDMVKEAIFATDIDRFIAEGMPERAANYAGHALPASSAWIQVARLAHPEFLIEIEAIALVPETRDTSSHTW